ncbi:MAG: hypothetical protein RLY85_1329 [Bacteroidota bacterium]
MAEQRYREYLFVLTKVDLILYGNPQRMKKSISILFSLMMLFHTQAQKIDYSLVDKDDYREMNFEIIGKLGSNIAVYKNHKTRHDISVYDNEMQLKDRVPLDFLPDRVMNVDFIPYNDFAYMVYQYQKRNTVYCSMVKINAAGKVMSDPVDLDTSQTSGAGENKIYSLIHSDDKKKILVFKIRRQNDKSYQISTLLFNNQMSLLKKSSFGIQVNDREGVFTDFLVDNDGDFVFGKCTRTGSREYINKIDLVYKAADADTIKVQPVLLKDKTLDEVKLKFDNYNKRIVMTSFFYKQKRGNIEGLYSLVWDKKSQTIAAQTDLTFSDSIRLDAKSETGNIKTAFNDHFIRHVIPVQDGGFAVVSELYYSSSRNNAWNRYDYLYGYGNPFYSPFDMWYYSPMNRFYGYNWYDPFNRFGQQNYVRYIAENIMVFFFDASGKLRWSNAIRKNQYDDQSDSFISYQLFNTGNEIRFLFNQKEKRELLLNSATIDAEGRIKRQPTLKNLNREYDFMPKFGKQVGLRQIIIPCLFKNYICFAKIEF